MKPLMIEIWSDIVCPWCYIGEHRFQEALANFEHHDDVQVIRRSFQLDPSTPRDSKETTVEMLSHKYGKSTAEALRMEQQVAGLAAQEGLPLEVNRIVANTFDAHRLLHLAAAQGHQEELAKRLFAAHFAERQAISDHDTLVRLATEAGLDPQAAQEVLAGDTYADDVQADIDRAAGFGIRGVPFFVLNERFGVSGGQPAAVHLEALQRAWDDAHSSMKEEQ